MHKDIDNFIKGFVPEFGNQKHLDILARYQQIRKMYQLAKTDNARLEEIERITMAKTARHKEIREKERSLIRILKQLK